MDANQAAQAAGQKFDRSLSYAEPGSAVDAKLKARIEAATKAYQQAKNDGKDSTAAATALGEATANGIVGNSGVTRGRLDGLSVQFMSEQFKSQFSGLDEAAKVAGARVMVAWISGKVAERRAAPDTKQKMIEAMVRIDPSGAIGKALGGKSGG